MISDTVWEISFYAVKEISVAQLTCVKPCVDYILLLKNIFQVGLFKKYKVSN